MGEYKRVRVPSRKHQARTVHLRPARETSDRTTPTTNTHTMDDYSYFNSQHSSSLGLPSLYIPPHKANAMTLPLIDNLHTTPDIYQSLDIHPSFSEFPTPPSDAVEFRTPTLASIKPELYQPTPLNITPSRIASSCSATATECDSDSHTDVQSAVDSSSQSHKSKNVKRRQQNRDAQRRYRERRDERTKSLEQTVLDLEAKRQWLSNNFYQKSQEIMHLYRDNDHLKAEVHELRQRWQLMIMLLQRPRALQSLSTLMAEDVGVGGALGSVTVEPKSLDEFLRCLDAVLAPGNEGNIPEIN
ncbi:hypothetical protein BJX63DRAFT_378183 [Aspergillus granulosus]|uniref:BZIP domain-containing protein n=1 Tax=Aspergillus granulosus TaxID=176169 RepID=A0ABR4I144_9EURO